MDDSQLLAKLHDIKLPAPTGWWPMAPGWIMLIALICFSLVILSYFLLSRWVNGRAKSQALQLLNMYYQAYQRDGNAQTACIQLSELLRRVALVYFPRAQVAGLHGEAWVNFLVQNAQEVDLQAIRNGLLFLPYQVAQDNKLYCNSTIESLNLTNENTDIPRLVRQDYEGSQIAGSRGQVAGRRRFRKSRIKNLNIESNESAEAVFAFAKTWIKQRGKPCLS